LVTHNREVADVRWQADLRAGLVAAVVANTARDPKKRPRPWTPSDFVTAPAHRATTTPDRLLRTVEQINAALGGRDLRTEPEEVTDVDRR